MTDPDHEEKRSRYAREVNGMMVDIYDIARAWGLVGVHYEAVKKLMCPGGRSGGKSRLVDLQEVVMEVQRMIEWELKLGRAMDTQEVLDLMNNPNPIMGDLLWKDSPSASARGRSVEETVDILTSTNELLDDLVLQKVDPTPHKPHVMYMGDGVEDGDRWCECAEDYRVTCSCHSDGCPEKPADSSPAAPESTNAAEEGGSEGSEPAPSTEQSTKAVVSRDPRCIGRFIGRNWVCSICEMDEAADKKDGPPACERALVESAQEAAREAMLADFEERTKAELASTSAAGCRVQIRGDRTECLFCTLQWDTNDPSPPNCPANRPS